MPERYVVDPKSGEEFLLRDGESAKDGLRRREMEKIEQARADLQKRLKAASNASTNGRPQPSSPSGEPARPAEVSPNQVIIRRKRTRIGLAIGGAVAAVAIVGAIIAGVVATNTENQAVPLRPVPAATNGNSYENYLEGRNTSSPAATDGGLAAAKKQAQDLLTTGADFAASSASYTSEAEKADLQVRLTNLQTALTTNTAKALNAAIGELRAAIKTIGTPEEAAARQAAAAQKAIDDQYLAAAQAAGTDTSNREAALRAAHTYCDTVVTQADASLEIQVASIRSKPRNDAAVASFCPQYSEAASLANRALNIGSAVVGVDIPEGTYTTLAKGVKDCYWERSSGGGDIIDNNFIGFAPDGVTVTVYAGEGFTTSGCGLWLPQ